MPTMAVRHDGGVSSVVEARGHRITADVPPQMGGEDRGPTPVELLTGALGSCIVFYVSRWCKEAKLPHDGMQVDLDYVLDMEAHCVPVINVQVRMPQGFPQEREAALLKVAEHCTVHNTLCSPPRIGVTVAGQGG